MTLRSSSKYPLQRAYVVKLSSEATSEELCGRIENLVSGQHRDFNTADELFQMMVEDLKADGDNSPDNV